MPHENSRTRPVLQRVPLIVGRPPSTQFSREELHAARESMDTLTHAHPWLTNVGIETRASAADAACIPDNRAQLLREDSLADFIRAREWLAQWRETSACKMPAALLVELAQPWIGPVSHGVFLAAALAESFRVRQIDLLSTQGVVNVSQRAISRCRRELARRARLAARTAQEQHTPAQ